MIERPIDFDEAGYLEANPDVAAAVASGHLASGEEHFTKYGYKERRKLRPGWRPAPLALPFASDVAVDRRDKILANLDLGRLEGVEIGALAAPVVAPHEGPISYVDFADTETLRTTYANDPHVNAADIVAVDAVWGEKTLSECFGGKVFDYVVASHVVEHCPDLVTWLDEIAAILKPGGELRLAVPDRRYTFDLLRNESRLHDVLDNYLRKARRPQPHQIIDFCGLSRVVDCAAAWDGALDLAALAPMSSYEFGFNISRISMEQGLYIDTHCWVFTPQSFADLMVGLAELGLIHFTCSTFILTARHELEFFTHLTPCRTQETILENWRHIQAAIATASAGAVIRLP